MKYEDFTYRIKNNRNGRSRVQKKQNKDDQVGKSSAS